MRVNKTIFLVDDDETVRCALSSVLRVSGYMVKPFPSAEAFLEEADGTIEGVMLLDKCMTGMSGIELHSELTKRDIDLPTIFITGHGDVHTSVKALKAGAIDFLEKPVNHEALLASINEAFLRLNNCKKYRSSVAEIKRNYSCLTEREMEVMQHVVAGVTNKDIAELLNVSDRTIEAHRSRVMKKMRAESLPDLVKKYDIYHAVETRK